MPLIASRFLILVTKALIEEYDPLIIETILPPQIISEQFEALNVGQWMQDGSDLARIFHLHNIGSDFAVEIVHRHFNAPADTRLVKVGRTVTPWSSELVDLVENRARLGSVAPEAIFLSGGLYYPYEFTHLTTAEAEALSGRERFRAYASFLAEFRQFVQERNIAHILGLRLLSKDEKARVEDPNVHDYEVTDSEQRMITLSSNIVLDPKGYRTVAWTFVDNRVLTVRSCEAAITECGCDPYTCETCKEYGCLCGHRGSTSCCAGAGGKL